MPDFRPAGSGKHECNLLAYVTALFARLRAAMCSLVISPHLSCSHVQPCARTLVMSLVEFPAH